MASKATGWENGWVNNDYDKNQLRKSEWARDNDCSCKKKATTNLNCGQSA